MSRRDKQADLRRRMAEARTKLVTSSHANASDLDNEIATDTSIKKRPLPSTGGILKKSKYSNTPAVPPPQTDTSKAEDNKSVNNNVLGSLMADYGGSSDEDTNTNTKTAFTSSNTDDQKQSSEVPIQPTATNNDIHQQTPKKKKKKKKKKDKPQIEDTVDVDSKIEAAAHKSEEEGKEKPTEVSDEVWDEFNALLDDDNDDGIVAKESISLKTEEIDNSVPGEEETSTNSETKKKKVKKKKSKKKKDIYDNDDMNTVEQASYEARLARLMLLKSKKTQNKLSTKTDEDNDEKLLSASTNEFYNGGLAFQQNDEEEDNDDVESKADTANLKLDGAEEAKDADDINTTTTSNTVASSISAPSVSLAAILRGRRDQARQLSRGGNDKIDTANDDEEEDESWF